MNLLLRINWCLDEAHPIGGRTDSEVYFLAILTENALPGTSKTRTLLGSMTSIDDSAASPVLHQATFDDFDQFARVVQGWDFEWHQLDRGQLEARLEQIQGPSVLLTRLGFSRQFHQQGSQPPGMLTFGFPGEGVSEVKWCGRPSTQRSLHTFNSANGYEAVSQVGFRGNTLSFSEDFLGRLAESLEIPGTEDLLARANQSFDCDPVILTTLRRKLRALFATAAADPSVVSSVGFLDEIETEIPTLMLTAMAGGHRSARRLSSSVRHKAARDALVLVRDRPEDPVTVQEICTAVGVSERTLQHAFREQFGVTPKRYLQAVRLDGVRRSLRSADLNAKVADVANAWGFWHLGQFAADYRRQFGELPSATLSRA